MRLFVVVVMAVLLAGPPRAQAQVPDRGRPNIVFLFADDISPREIPVYQSSVWSKPKGGDTSDPRHRATTPAMDALAGKGCWIRTVWATPTCMPTRAMVMTGRYAHQTKWWHNRDIGKVQSPQGEREWYLFESSPITLGKVALMGGYASVWAGKTHMRGDERDFERFEFTEAVVSLGLALDEDRKANTFTSRVVEVDGQRVVENRDDGKTAPGYPLARRSFGFKPFIAVMNDKGKRVGTQWWPYTEPDKADFGVNTYGPDVEQDYCLDFMQRQHDAGKPFFVYHATHLGHGTFDWLDPQSGSKWAGTPVIKWDGERYHRTPTNITGRKGEYDTHGTVTEAGLHSHINYIDYMLWRYMQKVQAMGVADNTIFIFSADNGSHQYGKTKVIQERGVAVPMIIYAPGMTKSGRQDILASLADILPTFADIMGVEIPDNYKIDGRSLWPYLSTQTDRHHDWIYSYRQDRQLMRGHRVLRDGDGKWWDVTELPADHTSFPRITDWDRVSQAHRDEKAKVQSLLPQFDLYHTEHGPPR